MQRNPQSGIGTLEMMFASALVLTLTAALTVSMGEISDATESTMRQSDQQRAAEASMQRIVEDLRGAAFVELDGFAYPYILSDALDAYDANGYLNDTKAAEVLWRQRVSPTARTRGELVQASTQIVFVRAEDLDRDGKPDTDCDGKVCWDGREITYMLLQRADGRRDLVRFVAGGSREIVARNIGGVAFDCAASCGFEIPMDCIRVRITFEHRDRKGNLTFLPRQAVVRLGNAKNATRRAALAAQTYLNRNFPASVVSPTTQPGSLTSRTGGESGEETGEILQWWENRRWWQYR